MKKRIFSVILRDGADCPLSKWPSPVASHYPHHTPIRPPVRNQPHAKIFLVECVRIDWLLSEPNFRYLKRISLAAEESP